MRRKFNHSFAHHITSGGHLILLFVGLRIGTAGGWLFVLSHDRRHQLRALDSQFPARARRGRHADLASGLGAPRLRGTARHRAPASRTDL